MELRECIGICRERKGVFWITLIVFLLVGVAWQKWQPVSYSADLSLNVARRGVQDTAEYRYDGFYRLQADERFADTVVEWLSSARIVQDIYSGAGTQALSPGIASFGGPISAKRLSSQLITVRYRATDREGADRLAKSIVGRVNQETDSLNVSAREKSWFTVLGGEPVIADARVPLSVVLGIMGALGIFAGFWMMLFTHYFRSGSKAIESKNRESGTSPSTSDPIVSEKPAAKRTAFRKWSTRKK